MNSGPLEAMTLKTRQDRIERHGFVTNPAAHRGRRPVYTALRRLPHVPWILDGDGRRHEERLRDSGKLAVEAWMIYDIGGQLYEAISSFAGVGDGCLGSRFVDLRRCLRPL